MIDCRICPSEKYDDYQKVNIHYNFELPSEEPVLAITSFTGLLLILFSCDYRELKQQLTITSIVRPESIAVVTSAGKRSFGIGTYTLYGITRICTCGTFVYVSASLPVSIEFVPWITGAGVSTVTPETTHLTGIGVVTREQRHTAYSISI